MSPFPTDPDVSTVHLGAFTHAHADAIAGELEAAGISWWYKQPGLISQLWEMGQVHLFVDRSRIDEARALAKDVIGGT